MSKRKKVNVDEQLDVTDDSYHSVVYEIDLPKDCRKTFTASEKSQLRPIAETLAMLDGNAFFGNDIGNGIEWYEQYLPEAWEVWNGHGGLDGWAGLTSWGQEQRLRETNPAVMELWDQYQTLLKLVRDEG